MNVLRVGAVVVLVAFSLAGCENATAPGPTSGTTAISFRAAGGSALSGELAGTKAHEGIPAGATISATGDNGELTFVDMHFVVSEFELERSGATEDACAQDTDAESSEDCEEFEVGPQFFELPLSGEDSVAVRQSVPVGTYKELEFEIEELEADQEDDDPDQLQQLLTQIRAEFSDWPSSASLRLHGTFTPRSEAGDLQPDQARPFTVYFEAEVEVEKEFSPLLEVAESAPSVTVVVDPTRWFQRGRDVVDLSQFDFNPSSQTPVVELEVEMEHTVDEAFIEIEVDND